MTDQMIFKRYEVKYCITRKQKELIKEAMAEHMIADIHGRSSICSLYFDTPDYLLVRHSLEHPFYKEKLRLRSYGVANDESTVFVELKRKYDSVVYKRRVGMSLRQAKGYLLRGESVIDTQITREIDYCLQMYRGIRPSVLLSYEREAYYGRDDHEFRITFDDNILWRDHDLTLDSGIYGTLLMDQDRVLMEVKTGSAIPLWLVRVLSSDHIYKTSFSKYGTAYTCILQNKQLLLQNSSVLEGGPTVQDGSILQDNNDIKENNDFQGVGLAM